MTIVDMKNSDVGTQVSLRGSANTINLADQGGYVELQVNSGLDNIVFTSGTISVSTVASGVMIQNFDFSGDNSANLTDKMYFGGSAGALGLVSAGLANAGHTSLDALQVVFMTSAQGQTISIAGGNGSAETDVIIVGTGIDAGSIQSALAWIGANASASVLDGAGTVSAATATLASAGQILVMFYNASGQETQLHLVGLSSTFANTFTATNTDESDLLARFNDNIKLYSGTNWGGTFNLDE
jgi:hypothetical protein